MASCSSPGRFGSAAGARCSKREFGDTFWTGAFAAETQAAPSFGPRCRLADLSHYGRGEKVHSEPFWLGSRPKRKGGGTASLATSGKRPP